MWSIIVPSVGVPLLFVLVMASVESLAKPTTFWNKMTDVGWDLCILGIGVTGGIFSNPIMEQRFGGSTSLITAIVVIAVDLGFGTGILHLKKRRDPADRITGSACIFLGCLAVGLPAGLTF